MRFAQVFMLFVGLRACWCVVHAKHQQFPYGSHFYCNINFDLSILQFAGLVYLIKFVIQQIMHYYKYLKRQVLKTGQLTIIYFPWSPFPGYLFKYPRNIFSIIVGKNLGISQTESVAVTITSKSLIIYTNIILQFRCYNKPIQGKEKLSYGKLKTI